MYHGKFVQEIVDKLKEVEGLKAIVLGGSWASETQHPDVKKSKLWGLL